MKVTLDTKSILIGFLGAALLLTAFSFKQNSDDQEGKYRTTMVDKGVIILDTQNGDYIFTPYLPASGKVEWYKGSFQNTHSVSADNTKISKK